MLRIILDHSYRRPHGAHTLSSPEESIACIEQYASGASLFGENETFIFLDFSPIEQIVVKKKNALHNASHTFIFLTQKVPTTLKEYVEGKKPVLNKEKNINRIFTLSDALFSGDKKKLWVQFVLLKKEYRAEEMHGVLVWGIKTIETLHKGGEVSSWVAKKINTDFFTKEKTAILHFLLVTMLVQARSGAHQSLEELLELWILSRI